MGNMSPSNQFLENLAINARPEKEAFVLHVMSATLGPCKIT